MPLLMVVGALMIPFGMYVHLTKPFTEEGKEETRLVEHFKKQGVPEEQGKLIYLLRHASPRCAGTIHDDDPQYYCNKEKAYLRELRKSGVCDTMRLAFCIDLSQPDGMHRDTKHR